MRRRPHGRAPRHLGTPGRAISYEAALELGPMGLAQMERELARLQMSGGDPGPPTDDRQAHP